MGRSLARCVVGARHSQESLTHGRHFVRSEACLSGGDDRNASPLLGTVEFFPEEGKYHFDGHRACGIVWDPPTTRAHGGICPVCGKPVTVGVMHRVEALADRPEGGRPAADLSLPQPDPAAGGAGRGLRRGRRLEAGAGRVFQAAGRPRPGARHPARSAAGRHPEVGGERLAEGIGRMRRGEVDRRSPATTASTASSGSSPPRASPRRQMGLFGDESEERGAESVERRAEGECRASRSWRAVIRDSRCTSGQLLGLRSLHALLFPLHELVRSRSHCSTLHAPLCWTASTPSSAPPSSAPMRRWSSWPARARARRAR